jgi:hypothetical protein
VYWLSATEGADADASFTPLPENAQPPAAPAGDLLPHPRCMPDRAVAFATAGGPVALVAASGATTLLTSDAALGAYTGARALAAVGTAGGLCFVASVGAANCCWKYDSRADIGRRRESPFCGEYTGIWSPALTCDNSESW